MKTLVDLAMRSAQGDGDLEIEKVNCLNSSAIGYAPLIFDFNVDAGFKQFLKQCKLVWNAFEADKDLPNHLETTNKILQWLNHVKESHGSVEANALQQAASINARGFYFVRLSSEMTPHQAVIQFILDVHKCQLS